MTIYQYVYNQTQEILMSYRRQSRFMINILFHSQCIHSHSQRMQNLPSHSQTLLRAPVHHLTFTASLISGRCRSSSKNAWSSIFRRLPPRSRHAWYAYDAEWWWLGRSWQYTVIHKRINRGKCENCNTVPRSDVTDWRHNNSGIRFTRVHNECAKRKKEWKRLLTKKQTSAQITGQKQKF